LPRETGCSNASREQLELWTARVTPPEEADAPRRQTAAAPKTLPVGSSPIGLNNRLGRAELRMTTITGAAVMGWLRIVLHRSGMYWPHPVPYRLFGSTKPRPLTALTISLAISILVASCSIPGNIAHRKPQESIEVPFFEKDIEVLVPKGPERHLPSCPPNCGPDPRDWTVAKELAEVTAKLKNTSATYYRPNVLLLGSLTSVQFVIKTNLDQPVDQLFNGFDGEVTATTVRVASDVSAELTASPDMLEITLRGGEKMRSILSPAPITWVWDVKALKPGKAIVILQVFSRIKIGGEVKPVEIRVLQDSWSVEARGLEWLKYQIAEIEPVRASLFAIVSAIVAVLGYFGFRGWRRGDRDLEV
jgi:hypothetical protein